MYRVVFATSERVYRFRAERIQIHKLQRVLTPDSVVITERGKRLSDVKAVYDYDAFYRIVFRDGRVRHCARNTVTFGKNCLADEQSRRIFDYFTEIAKIIELVTDKGRGILETQYRQIEVIDEETALAHYLNPNLPIRQYKNTQSTIFPFGLNQSQRQAVENAFLSQVSHIQGPPGTGKTQTILNIIANVVLRGKCVAVVSNNNAAIQNIADRLRAQGLGFLVAPLGNAENIKAFLKAQPAYPDMKGWELNPEDEKILNTKIEQILFELKKSLEAQKRIAEIEQELLELRPELCHFERLYATSETSTRIEAWLNRLTSEELLTLWVTYESHANREVRLRLFGQLGLLFHYGWTVLRLFRQPPEVLIPLLQRRFYQTRNSELTAEKVTLENHLKVYAFDKQIAELKTLSMRFLQAHLAQRYNFAQPRNVFDEKELTTWPETFVKEYPIVLSTTYSIKHALSSEWVYDYLVVDEASQVDLVTGALALSCARNIVIVGDLKQLPNVISSENRRLSDNLWKTREIASAYRFAGHSLLSSALEVWKTAPSVMLREHYRCHPKIANFFNRRFYDGKLIVMTEDHGEPSVLTMIRTAPGNHARNHLNRRQIDVVAEEVLPRLHEIGCFDIGIIAPYREQVTALEAQLGSICEVATVHRFQGREKEAIVLTSVDNTIGRFVADPNLVNVAVSRATRALAVIVSDDRANDQTLYGDLAKYIRYYNLEIVESQITSVFDLLYRGHAKHRATYLSTHRRISQFDSENLGYAIVEDILKHPKFHGLDCAIHSSLATLIQNTTNLSDEEAQFAKNPLSHIDLLLFERMGKTPILAIEIDGTRYHAAKSRQAERDTIKDRVLEKINLPLLRIRTDESGVQERIISALEEILNNNAPVSL